MCINNTKIGAVILDMDDTLYDCSGTLSRKRREELAGVIARYKGCSEKEALELLQKDEEVRKHGRYEGMARRLDLPPSFLEEVQGILQRPLALNQIRLFPDVDPTLRALRGRGLKVFLVTSGNPEEQQAKLNHLGLNPLLDEIIIVKRDGEGKTKGKCFQWLLEKYSLSPEEVLCVGDRMEDELAAAHALGMPTVMLRHGQHYERFISSAQKETIPNLFITNIGELLGLLS